MHLKLVRKQNKPHSKKILKGFSLEALLGLQVLTLYTKGINTPVRYTLNVPQLATLSPLCCTAALFFLFFTPSRTATKKILITQNTVLTFSSSGAAGWVAVGLIELLVSAGPSGRAACWEPNERVHERRIELCGDGAS